MIEYLPQALSSLSTALDIGKRITEIRDNANLQQAVVEFNNSIIEAQEKIISSQQEQTELLRKIEGLQAEVARLNSWEEGKAQYERVEIASGVFAYLEIDRTGDFQSSHKYCCNCFDRGTKSTLQQYAIREGRKKGLSCHNGCRDLIFNHYKNDT